MAAVVEHLLHRRRHASCLTAAMTVLVLGSAGCRDVRLHGVVLHDPMPAAALRVDRPGEPPYVLAADTGKLVLLYYGYTECPDYCPMMLTDWKRVRRDLGERAAAVRFVFVSVDPERDTPALTAAYAKDFDPAFVGLAPAPAVLAEIQRAWGFVAYKELSNSPSRSASRYGMAHPAHAYLVDRRGRLIALYPPETRWQDLAADLRSLL
jgi:protein SCO1/2